MALVGVEYLDKFSRFLMHPSVPLDVFAMVYYSLETSNTRAKSRD